MPKIVREPGVDEDIYDEALYLSDRSERTALRFLIAVDKSMREVARWPKMGSRKDSTIRNCTKYGRGG